MSALKDLVDLTAHLRNSRREAWIGPFVEKFQTITASLQREHSEIVSENLDLKRQMFHMEQAHAKAITERDKEIAKLKHEADAPPSDQLMSW